MKKLVAVLLCLMMLLSLFSCDIENSNDNKDNDITSNTDSNTLSEETDTTPIQKTQSEIAMEVYESVLKNEIKVYETDIQEYNYLANCKTPYNRIPLADCEQLKYA